MLPFKKCRKCGRSFMGEGNLCYPCKTGTKRKKSKLLSLTMWKTQLEKRLKELKH